MVVYAAVQATDLLDFPIPFTHLLHHPEKLIWPNNSSELYLVRERCRKKLSENLYPFLDVSIFTASLLDRGRYNQIDDIHTLLTDLGGILPDAEEMLLAQWVAVPVVGVSQGTHSASLTNFILGIDESNSISSSEPWPGWVEKVVDYHALQAIKDGFAAALTEQGRSARFVIYPLCDPNGDLFIKGRSLGLPIALAAQALLVRGKLSENCLATGDIVPNGDVCSIADDTLAGKIEAAEDENFQLFLYPLNNNIPANQSTSLQLKPVSTLRQTFIWSSCYSPGMHQEVQRLDTALQSAEDLVNNIGSIPAPFFEWIHSTNIAKQLVDEICGDQELAASIADKLRNLIKKRKGDYLIPSLIADLITEEEKVKLMGAQPATALSWCLSHLALADHSGDLQNEKYWGELGDLFFKGAAKNSDDRKLCFEFVNRRSSVGKRHNRFHFHPELEEEFSKYLLMLETQYEAECLFYPCQNYTLGSMYGTVGQNYAFCGPDYLAEARRFFEKAKDVFGCEDKENLQQEDSYLFFALLDGDLAELAEEAMQVMLASFGISSVAEIDFATLEDRFQQFALMRALNDIPGQFPGVIMEKLAGQTFKLFNGFDQHVVIKKKSEIHPWQLWCYNLGNLAFRRQEENLAIQAWEKSYHLCMRGGDTIRVMALLPLAKLALTTIDQKKLRNKVHDIITFIRHSNEMNKKHFAPLLDMTSDEMLKQIAEQAKVYFPFNYR